MDHKWKFSLICLFCLVLFSCNRVNKVEVTNNDSLKSYTITDSKHTKQLSKFLENLKWNKKENTKKTDSPDVSFSVDYKGEKKVIKYSLVYKSVGTSTIYSSSSKEGTANLNKSQTKEIKEILK